MVSSTAFPFLAVFLVLAAFRALSRFLLIELGTRSVIFELSSDLESKIWTTPMNTLNPIASDHYYTRYQTIPIINTNEMKPTIIVQEWL